MDLLLWLQSIRTPALDAFFLLVTKLGEDTFLLLPILLFYWCLDKRIGLRLGFIAFFSSLANQTTKLIFRVERPFVQNPTLQPVEGARAGATGYSFPSGHSTSATSLGMALILTFRKKWWIWLCSILYVALVCFSRLYLGVHTPADVLMGFLMTVVVSLVVHALFNDSDKHPERKDLYLILSMLLSLGALAWGLVVVSTGLAPAELSVDIFKIAGAALGMLIGVEPRPPLRAFRSQSAAPDADRQSRAGRSDHARPACRHESALRPCPYDGVPALPADAAVHLHRLARAVQPGGEKVRKVTIVLQKDETSCRRSQSSLCNRGFLFFV